MELRKVRPAKRNAWLGVGFIAFALLVSAITNGMTPTTQLGALLPGLTIGLSALIGIILLLVAIVQAILNRRS